MCFSGKTGSVPIPPKTIFNGSTTGHDQLLRKHQHPQKKKGFFLFFSFQKVGWKTWACSSSDPKGRIGRYLQLSSFHWGSIKANTSLIIALPTLSSELQCRISWINIYNTPERRAGIISPCFKDGRRWEKAEAICCNSQRKSVVRQGRVQSSHCLCLCHKTILPVPKCQAPAWWCAVLLAY